MPRSIVAVVGTVCLVLLLVWVVVNLVQDPTRFFNILLIGLTNGAVYGLIALGYTLVYGILQLINFANGDVFALGGLVASTMILTVFDLSTADSAAVIVLGIAATLAVAMAFSATLNAGIELVAYRRLRNAPRLAPLITAVGMSFILQNVGLIFWGVNFTSVPRLVPNSVAFSIGDVDFQWNKIAVILITPAGAARAHLPRQVDQAGKGDACHLAGPRGGGDDGRQREPDDLVHVHPRRWAGRRRRAALPPQLHRPSATTRASSSA